MSATAIEILRRANAVLRSGLTRFQPERTRCSTVQAQELYALRAEIRSAAGSLRDLPPNGKKDPVLERQLSEFQGNLKQLKQALPGFHSRLRAELERLAAAHTHSVAAGAWVQANKKTL
jgi:hypothetical protein